MKKAFYNPEMTIVEFEDENLIATSGGSDGSGNTEDMEGGEFEADKRKTAIWD